MMDELNIESLPGLSARIHNLYTENNMAGKWGSDAKNAIMNLSIILVVQKVRNDVYLLQK